MGKKAKSPTPASTAPQQNGNAGASADAVASIASLKDQANTAFAKKEYQQALSLWDQALKLASPDSPDAALLHSNKAAALMLGRRFREAANECSAALDVQPTYFKALVRRSRAYEGMGLLKQALTDMQRANRLDAATEETRATEARLRAAVGGKKPPSGLGGGLAPRAPGTGNVAPRPQSARQVVFPAKISFGDDVRALQLVPGLTYLELQEHVRQLFPAAGPSVIKYLDCRGDLVTVGSRADLQLAMQQSIEAAQRTQQGARLSPASLEPIRFRVVRVSSEDEVPRVPPEELAYVQQMLSGLQKAAAAERNSKAVAAGEEEDDGTSPTVQVDEWILSFVDLLKEHCGIDPDRPLEASEVGSERLQAAFQEMMNEDARADGLLDEATAKFEDQVCFGMYNQASVEQYRAEFLMYRAARAGERLTDELRARVETHLAAADAKHGDALAYKASFLDGYLGRSSVAQSRAKLAADYLLEPVKPREDVADPEERAAAESAANRSAQAKAFERVTAESARAAEPFMEASYALIREAVARMPEEESAKEIKLMKPTAEQTPGDPESEMTVKASLMINLGNAFYEHSILLAAGGLDWRPLVEKAIEQFKTAGAHETDIRNALKGHPMAAELADLIGPEPEPTSAATAAATEEQVPEPAPKGLPALPSKNKKAAPEQ